MQSGMDSSWVSPHQVNRVPKSVRNKLREWETIVTKYHAEMRELLAAEYGDRYTGWNVYTNEERASVGSTWDYVNGRKQYVKATEKVKNLEENPGI